MGDLFGGDLVPHFFNRTNGGPDKGHASGLKRLSELGVLGQEAITGVNRLGTRLLDRLHHLVDDDIGLVRWGRANVDGFIGHLNMQRVFVRVRINRHRLDAHGFGSLDHAAGNLAPVGNQNFLEHYAVPLS